MDEKKQLEAERTGNTEERAQEKPIARWGVSRFGDGSVFGGAKKPTENGGRS